MLFLPCGSLTIQSRAFRISSSGHGREMGTGAWTDDRLAKHKTTNFFAILIKQIIQNRSLHFLTFCLKNTESSYAS